MKLKLLSAFLLFVAILFISSCEKETSFENGGVPGGNTDGVSGGTALYDFEGAPSSCSGATLLGTYTAGTALTSSNTITVQVNVDSIGTYTVSTSTVNGMSFNGSGSFTNAGLQTITLTGSGTPTAGGVFNYTVGTDGCIFSVRVAAAPTNITGNFKAKIDGVQWVADKMAQGARMNGIINLTGLGLDKKTITITLTDSGVHQYTLAWDNTSNSAGAFMDSTLADVTAFASNAGSSPGESGGTVNITAIDEVNKTMTGTFSFRAKRQTDGTHRDITEGSFTNLSYVTSLTGNASNTMSVKVDGTLYTPTVVSGVIAFGSIIVTGTNAGADRSVMVTFPQTVTPGTYTIGGMLDSYYGGYNPNNDPMQATISNSGTLEIQSINATTRRVKGRFSFTSMPMLGGTTFTLSEGVFDTSY